MSDTLVNTVTSFIRKILLAGIVGSMAVASLSAQPAAQVELELKISGLGEVVDIQSAGDGRLFTVAKHGVIRIVNFDAQGNASVNPTPFLDISPVVVTGSERGLLGLAFHPDYAANGHFFVNYSCAPGAPSCGSGGDTIVARYTVSGDPDVASVGSALVIASIVQDASNHNGGQIQFEPFPDPNDGRTILYIGTGDGGGANDPNARAQDPTSLLGKMLRVDVDNLGGSPPRYAIPTDNPFIGDQSFADEIWSYGLRNPWRFSFDRLTGDMFIGDVGQNAREEIDFQSVASNGGENYGWRQCEGTRVNISSEAPDGCTGGGGLVPPILEYTHADGCSVTGGYVYRGIEFTSELGGTYFYADYCDGTLWGARNDGGSWWNIIDQATGLTHDIATFGEDHNGELYLGTRAGQLYRIRPPSSPEPDLIITAVDGPLSGNLGETISVASTYVQNQGTAPAGESSVGFYFSDDPQNQPRQSFSGATCSVPALSGGASHACIDTTVNVPAGLPPGPRSLIAVADDTDAVSESDESNNDLADPQPIELIDCAGAELCFDGFDNDCDGQTDGDDADCANACTLTGESCTSDAECCSNKCRGGSNKTCKGETTCTPTEDPETSCSDGLDNDCDGLTDGADPTSCSCTITQVPETSCNDAIDNDCDGLTDGDDSDCQLACFAKGDACTVNSDCCSNKCRGPNSNKTCK